MQNPGVVTQITQLTVVTKLLKLIDPLLSLHFFGPGVTRLILPFLFGLFGTGEPFNVVSDRFLVVFGVELQERGGVVVEGVGGVGVE